MATYRTNKIDSFRVGKKHDRRRKVDDETKNKIIGDRKVGLSYRAIGDKYGLHANTVSMIINPERYKKQLEYYKGKKYRYNLSKETRAERMRKYRAYKRELIKQQGGQ